MATDYTKLLTTLAILLVVLAIQVFLIMIIWNNVIRKKFPSANIQKLDFWDALALGVFTSILFGSSSVCYSATAKK